MEQVVATVNINIGLGKNNPSLIIYQKDSIPDKVNKLIDQYKLPKSVYQIIMKQINLELNSQGHDQTKIKDKSNVKNAKDDKKYSVSPIKGNYQNNSNKTTTHRNPTNLKQNSKNLINFDNSPHQCKQKNTTSSISKSNVSIKKRKYQPRPSKTPVKKDYQRSPIQPQTAKTAKQHTQISNIHKLFRHLTRGNPKNIKILSPEFINLKGMDRNMLSQLQQFFQCIDQQQFDLMTQKYFVNKVSEMKFKTRLGKKQYEYCFMI